jgi:hypothetical protein
MVRRAFLFPIALIVFLRVPPLPAQGVAGAVIQGMVVDSLDHPVPGAVVILRHPASGNEYRAVADERGRFRIEAQPAVGPWSLMVGALGYRPAPPQTFRFEVGDLVYRLLRVAPTELSVLPELSARASPIPADGGPGFTIPGEGIRELPILSRDFTRLFSAIPQALGRDLNSITGQHPGYNAILLDGATAADLYGVGRTPGSSAGAKAISLEALAGLRVMVAPFDVRHGGFAGGLISAVTRSGTNRFEGSLFTSLQRPFLVGRDTSGAPVNRFDVFQYGLTLGGPIVRDRLHFFAALDLQHSTTPFVGPEAGAPGTGISDSTARRAAQVFRTVYGFDAGSPESPVLAQPDRDLFAKLSWQPRPGLRFELTHNWVKARSDRLNRENRTQRNRGGWQLSESGIIQRTAVQATRLHVWASQGSWSNEASAGYETIADSRSSSLQVPLFLVQTDQVGTYLAGGAPVDAQGTLLNQRLIELTDNFTWTGGHHEVTAGGRLQLLKVFDNLFVNNRGVWRFPSVDALEQLAPDYYEVNLPLRDGGPLADFGTRMLAGYVQDRWSPSERVALTAGLRLEVPFIDQPLRNPALDTSTALGRIDTGTFPSGNPVLAPRIGLQVDLSRSWNTVLRLGAGVFTGPPPIAWLGGAFINTGLDQQNLVCTPTRGGVPRPITDPAQRPSQCLTSPGQAPPQPNVVAFSPGFHFPATEKLVAGLDHGFGSGMSASLDLMVSRTRNAVYLSDRNLEPGVVSAEGRTMYGTISGTGTALVSRPDPRFGQVLFFENRSRDRFRSLTLSLRKAWRNGGYLQLGGQWSRAEDLFTVNRNSANLTLQTAPLDGTVAERNLTRSGYDVPLSLTANGVLPLPGGFTISLLARHQSGRPYAYAVQGDVNADGVSPNDLLYVPESRADISLADPAQQEELDHFIEGEECLRRQRGRIMERNSCRNPGFTLVDGRLAWQVELLSRSVELSADFFNLLHLLSPRWGLIRETSADEARVGLVTVNGWDAAANRPIYSLITTQTGEIVLPGRSQVLENASRWRIQLGARIRF